MIEFYWFGFVAFFIWLCVHPDNRRVNIPEEWTEEFAFVAIIVIYLVFSAFWFILLNLIVSEKILEKIDGAS